jgi:hypothetical protein
MKRSIFLILMILALSVFSLDGFADRCGRVPNVNGDLDIWAGILNTHLNCTLDPLTGEFMNQTFNVTDNNVYLKNFVWNLGLGTTTPSEKLVVIGNVNISGTLNVSGQIYWDDKLVQQEPTSYKLGNFTTHLSAVIPQCTAPDKLTSTDGITFVCDSDQQGAGGTVTGIGSAGNLTLWSSGSTLGNSSLYYVGGKIGLGTLTPAEFLTIAGNISSGVDVFVNGKKAQLEPDAFKASNLTGMVGSNNSIVHFDNVTSLLTGLFNNQNFSSQFSSRLAEFWNSENLTFFLGGGNDSIPRYDNLTTKLSGNYNLANFTSNYAGRLDEQFNYGNNLTRILGDNASILRTPNISSIQNGAYNKGNFTSDYAERLGEQFNYANNLTSILGENASILRANNLSLLQVESSAFKRTNLTPILDNDTILRTGNMSVIHNADYNLANFTSNYASRLAEQFNYASNLTGILGDNSSILRTQNLSNLKVSNSTYSDNTSGINWNKINNIPSGFLDGIDDTSAGGGTTFNLENMTGFFGDPNFNSSVFRNSNFTNAVPACSGTDKLTSSDGNTLICTSDSQFNGTIQTWTDTTLPVAQLVINYSTSDILYANGTNIYSNVTVWGNLTAKTDFYIQTLTSQSCLGTDGSGKLGAGSCTGGGTTWNLGNLTNFFGDLSFNSSVLRIGNISNVLNGAYNNENFSTDYGTRLAEQFNYINLTSIQGDNATLIRTGNLSTILVGNASSASNASGVHWNKISQIPSGFLDGIDDTGGSSFANDSNIRTLSINNTGSINTTNITASNQIYIPNTLIANGSLVGIGGINPREALSINDDGGVTCLQLRDPQGNLNEKDWLMCNDASATSLQFKTVNDNGTSEVARMTLFRHGGVNFGSEGDPGAGNFALNGGSFQINPSGDAVADLDVVGHQYLSGNLNVSNLFMTNNLLKKFTVHGSINASLGNFSNLISRTVNALNLNTTSLSVNNWTNGATVVSEAKVTFNGTYWCIGC